MFSSPAQSWDNTSHLKLNKSKVDLWFNNWHNPAWVELQLTTWDPWLSRPPESLTTPLRAFAAEEGKLDFGRCSKLCEDGRMTDAVNALNVLVQRGCHVRNHLFYRLLKTCIANKDLLLGRRIHALIVESGYEGDKFLATHLIGLYASHGRLEEAMQVFTKVSTPSAYNWATIIFAYARHGQAAHAIRLYRQMRESTVQPDNRIYVAILKACTAAGDLVVGMEVHAHILASPGKPDIFVQTGLLDMYAKCGSVENARTVFDSLADRNVVTWNAMLSGYAQQGMGQEALSLYNSMQHEGLFSPDSVTFVSLLQACATLGAGALQEGKLLHAQIEERGLQYDVVVGGSLVNMYAKCGSVRDARNLFDRLPDRNVVSWNALLAGYAQQGMSQEALSLYRVMQQEGLCAPDSVTFTCLLLACASIGVPALHEGKLVHRQIEERGLQDDVVLGGSLVNLYAKCGTVQEARSLFDRLRNKNVLTWNAMLGCYAQQGMGQEALSLYSSMQEEGQSPPSSVTFVSLLQACASVGAKALHEGKLLHVQIDERGIGHDAVLGGSLVNMYAKCGSVKDARSVFDRLPDRNVGTCNAMLAGYAQQEMGQEALNLQRLMQQEGLSSPDSVTFTCLLQACAV